MASSINAMASFKGMSPSTATIWLNILDEYDEDEEYIEATDNADEYIIEGKTPLEELEERFHSFTGRFESSLEA